MENDSKFIVVRKEIKNNYIHVNAQDTRNAINKVLNGEGKKGGEEYAGLLPDNCWTVIELTEEDKGDYNV